MENSYQIPELSARLAQIAEQNLPNFIGNYNKALQVLVRFNYGKHQGRLPLGVEASPQQYIKIIFWHPKDSMLIGYDFESLIENIFDNFSICSNSNLDSAWKEDLDFFHRILTEPKSWDILESAILDIRNFSFIADDIFTFSLMYK